MSEVEVLAELRKKDLRKNELSDKITAIKERIANNALGSVSISIVEPSTTLLAAEFSLRGSTAIKPVRSSGPAPDATLPVETLSSVIAITLETVVGDAGEGEESEVSEIKTFTTEFDCSLLPTNTSLVTELEASSLGESIIVKIEAVLQSNEELLQSTMLEFEQVSRSIGELKDASLQNRKTEKLRKSLTSKKPSSSSGKVKKSKPTRADADSSGSAKVAKSKSSAGKSSSSLSLAALGQYALLGGALALEHRAFILFPLAAVAIYFRGEVMSV